MNFFDSFTKGAQRVLIIAQEEARRMGHNYVGTEHILLGTIKEKSSVSTLLSQLGVTYEKVCAEIENLIGMGDFNFSEAFGYTPRTKRVLEMSKAEANKLGQNYVGTEHILFALLLETEGVANRILRDLGVNTKELYEKMIAATVADLKKRGQNPGAAGESGRAAGGDVCGNGCAAHRIDSHREPPERQVSDRQAAQREEPDRQAAEGEEQPCRDAAHRDEPRGDSADGHNAARHVPDGQDARGHAAPAAEVDVHQRQAKERAAAAVFKRQRAHAAIRHRLPPPGAGRLLRRGLLLCRARSLDQFVQGEAEQLRQAAQPRQVRLRVSVFPLGDGLPGDAHQFCELLLGEVARPALSDQILRKCHGCSLASAFFLQGVYGKARPFV